MFWGHTLKAGSSAKLSQDKGELLHLSHANLEASSPEGLTTVYVSHQGNKYPLTHLDKSRSFTANLDLYFSTQTDPVFSVEGPGQVTLLGYFEPTDKFSDQIGTGSEEEVVTKDLPKSIPEQIKADSSDDDGESSEEEVQIKQVTAVNKGNKSKVQEIESDSDEEEDEDSDDSDDSEDAPSTKKQAAPKKETSKTKVADKKKPKDSDSDSDSDDDDDEDKAKVPQKRPPQPRKTDKKEQQPSKGGPKGKPQGKGGFQNKGNQPKGRGNFQGKGGKAKPRY